MKRCDRGSSHLWVVLAVAAIVLLVLLYPELKRYAHLENLIRNYPKLSQKPLHLPIATPLNVKATPVTWKGFELDTPWGKPERVSVGEIDTTFHFAGGRELELLLYEDLVVPWWGEYEASKEQENLALLRSVYGPEYARTRYDSLDRIISHVPQQPRLLQRKRRHAELMITYTKNFVFSSTTSALYSFTFPNGRGFQVNDPSVSPSVLVHFFDSADRYIWVTVRGSAARPLTQSEIDFVIRSIRQKAKEELATEAPPTKKKPST